METIHFHGHRKLSNIILAIAIIGLVLLIFKLIRHPLDLQQTCFLLLFSTLTVIFLFLRRLSFTVFFLLSTFTMITTWRLAGLANLTLLVYIYLIAVILKVLNYIFCAYYAIKSSRHHVLEHRAIAYEWQLLFVRLLIGFILIPHFCEKLFAGAAVRANDIHAFAQMGLQCPLAMVIIAGCMEFGAALTISCGILTRLGCICSATYLLTATHFGGHFLNGFIWAEPGGGWEYPVLWSVLILTFAVFGAGDFSLDRIIKNKYRVPTWLKHLMGGRFS